MAAYTQLATLSSFDQLNQQVKVAIAVNANEIITEVATTPNHAQRVAWAKLALSNIDGVQPQVFWAVVGANAGATLAQIEAATDAQVQAAVDAAVTAVFGT